MNPSVLGVLCLLLCVQSRSLRNERWNALDLSENRDLFLSALQAYFSRRGLQIDRTAPSFILMSAKLRDIRDSDPSYDEYLDSAVRAHRTNKALDLETYF